MPKLYLVDVATPATKAPALSRRSALSLAARTKSSRARSEKAVAGTSVTA